MFSVFVLNLLVSCHLHTHTPFCRQTLGGVCSANNDVKEVKTKKQKQKEKQTTNGRKKNSKK